MVYAFPLLPLVGKGDDSLIRDLELRPQSQPDAILGVHDLLEDGPVRQGIDENRSQHHDILRPVAGGFKLCSGHKGRVVLSQRLVKLDVESVDHVIDFSTLRSRMLIFRLLLVPLLSLCHLTSCSFTSPE